MLQPVRCEASTADSYLHLNSIDERRAIYRAGNARSFLWDLADLDHPRMITVPTDLGLMDSMDRTGSLLSAVGTDKTARVWRVGDRSIRRLPAADVVGTAVLPDGSGIVLSRRDGDQDAIERWTPDGRLDTTLLHVPHPAIVRAGPAGLIVITSYLGDVSMTIVDVTDPRALRVVARASGLDETAEAAFDTAGRTVAVVDGVEARIWDAKTGGRLLSLRTQGLRLTTPRLNGNELYLLDRKSAMWRIDSDLAAVIHQTCVQTVDVDWDRNFPGTARKQLCPRQ